MLQRERHVHSLSITLEENEIFLSVRFKTYGKTVIYHYAPIYMFVIFRRGPDTAQCELVLTLGRSSQVGVNLEENQTGGNIGVAVCSLKSLDSLLPSCAHRNQALDSLW
jgi:hypothetical protein